jgi:hypothetical protein
LRLLQTMGFPSCRDKLVAFTPPPHVSFSPRSKNFHKSIVTSDLARKIKLRNHGRGRDGWQRPIRRASKYFVLPILVPKFFDIRILRAKTCLSR